MNNKITLPLFETVNRSFMYIVKNLAILAKICSIFIILWIFEILVGLPSMCTVNANYCQQGILPDLSTVLFYLAGAIISVNIIRHIILKQEYKWFHISIGTYSFRYIGYTLLIAAMIIIPAAMILMISQAASKITVSPFIHIFLNVTFLTTLFGLLIFCFRLYLVLAGSAIGDKEMTLGKSYALTTGNMLKIFCGQFLLTIPTFILVAVIFEIYKLNQWDFVGNSIFLLLGIMCSFFDTAIKASYHCHLYQYFLYAEKHKTN